jgi:pyruvate dehydrogenase E2 component (dihydrolipoamide acetyltransferase)
MNEFRLPSLGSDMDEGKLLKWLVKPGDSVKRGQVVAVVDTSKAAVDVEIWQDGTMAAQLVEPGQTVPVGTPLAMIAGEGEAIDAAMLAAAIRTAATSAAPSMPASTAPARQPEPAMAVPATAMTPREAAAAAIPARRRVSPAARKHAEDLGIAIDTLAGTGPDGALTLQDVERAAQQRGAPRPPVAAPDRAASMRQAIAAAMSRSKREIPHYYLSESVPMQRAQQWLAEANAGRELPQRLLMAALQVKAVAQALLKYPDFNGFHVDGAYRPAAAVHVGLAVSLRQGGLVAPALHDAASKTLDALMASMTDLIARARAGSLRSSEMSDPTITITNLGERGVESVHGIIYPPQVALVGFGRITERVWAEDGALRIVPMVTATLAADHRVSDGHRGALFLAEIHDRLQHPDQL